MYSLNIVLIVLVLCFATIHSQSSRTEICTDDPFIHSEVTKDGKEFLYPWDHDQRNGDWYYNKGLCKKYCAVMVEILDAQENDIFHRFIREVGVATPGVWLGAQIQDASQYFQWTSYGYPRTPTYTNWSPGEPNERGLTCMHAAYTTNRNNPWYNYFCNLRTMHVACQRYVKYYGGSANATTAAPTLFNRHVLA